MQGDGTIHALASGSGTCGVAVIRVSGHHADTVLTALTAAPLPAPRYAALRRLWSADGTLLDQALVLRFPAGTSFTGEPVVELHCHGGAAVVRAVLDAVAAAGPSRLAEPGEFTLRAFRNGRMDLTEVEALGDLLAAETATQHRQAVRGLDGSLRTRVEAWRAALIDAAALVEVTIDWADEEVPEDVGPEVSRLLSTVVDEIDSELAVSQGAEKLRTGLEVAILGAPNAGKSSLLNALAGREAAITSPRPGTTRDVLELRYDLQGLAVTFLDTAGLRETDDAVERIGVSRARTRAEAADLRLILSAPDAPAGDDLLALARPGDIEVATKIDLRAPADGVGVSATTGKGVADLLDLLAERLRSEVAGDGLIAHEHQRAALKTGRDALLTALTGLDDRGAEEISEDIRAATRALERLTGRIGVEDMLGAVFGRFCLGK